MKIVLPGGSGQVGALLARFFHARGDEVVVLSRVPRPAPWRTAAWDGRSDGGWFAEIDGADVVINLAGRSVNCRYGQRERREILVSRVDSTTAVGRAVAAAARPPRVWLQAGTATIYDHRFDAANDEHSGRIGDHAAAPPHAPAAPAPWSFSVDVARAWEAALSAAATPRTRRVALRSAMVMSPDRGSIFDVLLGLVRRGLGGAAADGRQYVSWIHAHDFIAAIDWLIRRDDLCGPVNICSPHPLPNRQFMRALREAWGAPFGLPAKRWMLELGAWLLRTETELVLKSRRVVPARLLESGFQFTFPHWPAAAADLCRRWREANLPSK